MQIFKFNLATPPMYYVCGYLEINEPWLHKEMYQPGNYELIVLLAGKLSIEIEGSQYVINPSEYFIVPPYKHMKGFKQSPRGTKFIWIHFFPETKPATDSYYVAQLLQQGSFLGDEELLILAFQVLDSAENGKSIITDYMIGELLSYMGHSNRYTQLINGEKTTLPQLVKNWIDAHIAEIKTVNDIAVNFNFNSIYLNRIFKEQYHVSLYQYLIESKMSRARNLLISTDLQINEIAKQSFFTDEKYFAKAIKKRTGVTPSAYRNSFRKKFLNTPQVDPEIEVPERILERFKK